MLVNGKLAGAGSTWGLFCGAMSAVMYSFMVTLNRKSDEITGLENSVIKYNFPFIRDISSAGASVRCSRTVTIFRQSVMSGRTASACSIQASSFSRSWALTAA